ncbi:TolC family protein [Emticicia sp. BO119]|uniref:TolC family protein n=1 Tax=Emticicia sp. BO119 TaxID=2757768 RepID=UPI0015F0599D|nr:TolC family protein [Emticicia sp. BO119]MBA4849352.1 TolC family protein [Emticicia sp. BO119]
MKHYITTIAFVCLSFGSVIAQSAQMPLSKAVDLAIQNNKGLKAANLRVENNEAHAQEVKDRKLPQASASLSYSRFSLITPFAFGEGEDGKPLFGLPKGGFSATMGAVSVKKELFGGFAEKAAQQSADLLVHASKLDVQRNRQELVYAVTEAYYTIVKLSRSTDIINQNIQQFEAREKDARNLEKEGIILPNEVLKLQLQKHNLELNRLQVEKARETALYNFGLLIGVDDIQAIGVDTTLSSTPVALETLNSFLLLASQRRPELQANALRQQSADAQLRLIKSNKYPHIGLSAGYNYVNPNANFIPEANTFINAWNIGLGVSYNIGSLYNLKGRMNTAKASINETILQGQHQTDQVHTEVVTAYHNYELAVEQQKVIVTALQQAQENYRLIESRFRNGLVGSTELLDANSFLLQAQLNLINSKVDGRLAYERLLKATGEN